MALMLCQPLADTHTAASLDALERHDIGPGCSLGPLTGPERQQLAAYWSPTCLLLHCSTSTGSPSVLPLTMATAF